MRRVFSRTKRQLSSFRDTYVSCENDYVRLEYLRDCIVKESGASANIPAGAMDMELAKLLRQDSMSLLRTSTEGKDVLQEIASGSLQALETFYSMENVVMKQIRDGECPESTLHEIASTERVLSNRVEDLKHRLTGPRRVYGLFHIDDTAQKDCIAYINVVLAQGLLLTRLQDAALCVDEGPKETATYYSVNVPSQAYSGLDMGRRLVHASAGALKDEFSDTLTTLGTLSPVPGLRTYLGHAPPEDGEDKALLKRLEEKPAEWYDDEALAVKARPFLYESTRKYLTEAKTASGKEPGDPVGRFHLRNGATSLFDIHVPPQRGSTLKRNAQKSFGVLVNWLYESSVPEVHRHTFMNGLPVSHSVAAGFTDSS